MAFRCTVVTPEEQIFDEQVSQAIVPAVDGQIGFLTGHAPALVRIGAGMMRLESSGGRAFTKFVDGGVAQFKDNVLTVLADRAIDPGSIDKAAVQKQLDEALAAGVGKNEAHIARRKREIDRYRALLRVEAV